MATLEEQIAAQQVMIDELRAQVARLARRDSMQSTLTCPACGCGRILAVRQVNEHVESGTMPLTLGTSHFYSQIDGDPLFAYVCTQCRLVEWRLHSLTHLAPDGENVTLLERPPEPTSPSGVPYR